MSSPIRLPQSISISDIGKHTNSLVDRLHWIVKDGYYQTPLHLADHGMAVCSNCGSIQSLDYKNCTDCKDDRFVVMEDAPRPWRMLNRQTQPQKPKEKISHCFLDESNTVLNIVFHSGRIRRLSKYSQEGPKALRLNEIIEIDTSEWKVIRMKIFPKSQEHKRIELLELMEQS